MASKRNEIINGLVFCLPSLGEFFFEDETIDFSHIKKLIDAYCIKSEK